MSLQVWLPLNGDLRNQGCSNPNISLASGNSWASSGKIGNNSLTLTKLQTILPTSSCMSGAKEISYCYWVKVNTAWSANWLDGIRWIETDGSTTSTARQEFYTNCTLVGTWYKGGSISGKAFTPEVWTHLAATFNYNTGEANFYIDGVLKGTTTNIDKTYYCRGDFYIGDNGVDICQNDVRIYDHCLSAAEVKEISQGLVLHYKLDDIPNSNMIKNGFGELGLENWVNSSRVSTDVPSADTSIKQSFYNQWTQEQVLIISSHQYQFSCYVKSTGTSGYTYPSFQPYDIDGKSLNYYHEPEGFQSATRTTLAQPLNPGDTKIYATSLANWPDHTNNRLVAIFSYRDSHGNLYPDWEYTQNTPLYGTSANLNKSTNVITLSAAYTGPSMPAGTSICQTVYGSTYWYPFGGITKTSIANWTAKTMTFIPKNVNRLKYAHSIKYLADWQNDILHAGIELIDLTYSNIIEDSSGYGHHGEIINSLGQTSDTPRYNSCVHIRATNQKIKLSNFPTSGFGNSYSFSWWAKISSVSPMHWGFADGIRLNGMYTGRLWNTGDSSSNPLYTPGTTTQVAAPTVNAWHHWVMTGDGTTCKVYQDGVYWGVAKTYKAISGQTIYINGWDSGTSYCSDNYSISDFRIYATALSADDILTLYHTGAKIGNQGDIHAYELNEGFGIEENAKFVNNSATSMTYDAATDTYTIVSPVGTSSWGYGVRLADTPALEVPYGMTYRWTAEVYTPVALTVNTDYNNAAINATSWSGNDNDATGTRLASGTSIPANTWTRIYRGASNTNTNNTGHASIRDYSSLGLVTNGQANPVTWKVRHLQWYLVDTTFKPQIKKTGIIEAEHFTEVEQNLNKPAQFNKQMFSVNGNEFIEL